MQYVICYDIADDHRRYRLAQSLLNFGSRVQESVFVANLDDDLKETMLVDIQKHVDQAEDRVHIFVLCATCEGKVVTIGQAEVVVVREFYVL